MPIPDKQAIVLAHARIKPYIHHTPVLTSTGINELAGCSLFFKCENFQKIGAFKARGAMNALLSLSPGDLKKGVATHSSGNHAQAVARAAKILNVKSYIVMPRTSSDMKKRGVRGFDGEIFECEPTLDSRETMLQEVVMKTGATVVHPFNDYAVVAGQATAAKELFEDIEGLEIIITPVGGGGLLSGTALAANYFSPGTTVMAGEPAGADDTFRSMQSGTIQPSQSNSIADGLLTTVGEKTFSIIGKYVTEIITVSDTQIISAMRLLWERMKIIVEPSGAVPVAAILHAKEKFAGRRVGVIISGGNVDLERALKLFESETSS